MNALCRHLLPLVLAALPFAVNADSDKDESGHGRYGRDRHEYKEEFWDGHCKVERKVERNGAYKEERKCKGPRLGYQERAPVYVPASPPIVVEPGITIHGTVRIGQ